MTNDVLIELETELREAAAYWLYKQEVALKVGHDNTAQDYAQRSADKLKRADALSALLREREMAQEMFKDSANSMSHNQK